MNRHDSREMITSKFPNYQKKTCNSHELVSLRLCRYPAWATLRNSAGSIHSECRVALRDGFTRRLTPPDTDMSAVAGVMRGAVPVGREKRCNIGRREGVGGGGGLRERKLRGSRGGGGRTRGEESAGGLLATPSIQPVTHGIVSTVSYLFVHREVQSGAAIVCLNQKQQSHCYFVQRAAVF